ncbi:MAG: VWA domain-containing protein, partial [Akkermansiaceae bacterium]
ILVSLGQKPKRYTGRFNFPVMIPALFFAIIAMARPQIQETHSDHTASGIDIILALDISYSMEIVDFNLHGRNVQRITAAKSTAESFIKSRSNDRIGIVAFSGRPYVTSPITLEHDWLIEQLRELRPGFVQEQGTAIGSAISASATRLNDWNKESKSKVVVLVTDGSNNTGKISPMEAAKKAAVLGIKIYTVAIGTEEGRLRNGMQAYPQKEFDTDTLEKIAKVTKAEYYRVRNTEKLRETFQSIDQLEKTEIKTHSTVTREELFIWPLGLALILALFALAYQALKPSPAP